MIARWRTTLRQVPYRFPRIYDWLTQHGILRWLGMSGHAQAEWVNQTLYHEGRLLDAPFGTGVLTMQNYAQRPAITVIGVDLALAMLKTAQHELRQRGIVNVHLVCADMTALPFAHDQFSQIVTLNGLQVLPYPETLVDELLRVAEDGCVVVGTATVNIGLEPRGGLQRLLVRLGLINDVDPEKLHDLLGMTWSKLSGQRTGAVYHFRRAKLDPATGEPVS